MRVFKKGDWVLIFTPSLFDQKEWSAPLQLETDAILGWLTGDFSKIFISAGVHPGLEKDLGPARWFVVDPRVTVRGFDEIKYAPIANVKEAMKKDFDDLIDKTYQQYERSKKEWRTLVSAKRKARVYVKDV